jgi:hypothetical protein
MLCVLFRILLTRIYRKYIYNGNHEKILKKEKNEMKNSASILFLITISFYERRSVGIAFFVINEKSFNDDDHRDNETNRNDE